MRRLVFFLFALALLCQGAWAVMGPDYRFGACCGSEMAASAAGAPVPAGQPAQDGHAPCDSTTTPCDDDGCLCQGPGLTGLPIQVPTLPAAAAGVIVAGVYLRHVPDHVPDSPLRPPHTPVA